jgi:MFS family permease
LVYLILQLPAGMLLDRFGPRFMLACGLATMSSAQLLFAVTHTFPCALAARAILGTGDVMIFISVLRLIASWFPERQNPLMGQLATAVGIGCGSVASAAPLSAALRVFGWNATFVSSALMGAALIGVVLVGLRNNPTSGLAPSRPRQNRHRRIRHCDATPASWLSALRETWGEPGTRLGLWVHFTCQFPGNAFLLLWGFPFLTRGAGLESTTALRVLMLIAVSAVILGPVLGKTVGHFPRSRLPLALGIALTTLLTLSVVLAWPGRSPLWLLILLAVVLGASNPGSLIGMDYARLHNPARRLGVACSIVNIGGYSATAIAVLGVGYVIDALEPATAEAMVAYRAAFALFLPMLAIGLWKVIRWHRKVRLACPTERTPADPLSQRDSECADCGVLKRPTQLHQSVADHADELIHCAAVHRRGFEDKAVDAEFGIAADRIAIHRPRRRRDGHLQLAQFGWALVASRRLSQCGKRLSRLIKGQLVSVPTVGCTHDAWKRRGRFSADDDRGMRPLDRQRPQGHVGKAHSGAAERQDALVP